MSFCRVFCPKLAVGTAALSDDEAHHAATVRRLQVGDEVVLFDGAGREGLGRITAAGRRTVTVEVARIVERPFETRHRLTLAVAMPKAHRAGYLIEKCTELGVAAFWPITSERSVARAGAAAVAKWSRRAVEAAKQSGRAWIPNVEAPRTFAATCASAGTLDGAFLAELGASLPSLSMRLATLPAPSRVLVWIGPEGGWSPAERDLAISSGGVAVRLSPTVLRTETAAVAACAAVAAAT